MKTRVAKTKGKTFQNEVRSYLIDQFNICEEDIISNPMGNQGEDIILSKRGREIFPFSIECKRIEKVSIYGIIDQVMSNCKNNYPLIIMRKNRMEPWCITKLEIFNKITNLIDINLNLVYSIFNFTNSNIYFDSIEVSKQLNVYKSIDKINKRIKNIKKDNLNGSILFCKKEGQDIWIGTPFYKFCEIFKENNKEG